MPSERYRTRSWSAKIFAFILPFFWIALGDLSWASPPKPAPPIFNSLNYGLTFRAPLNTTICPLPENWVGPDHGSVIFLSPPVDCGVAGFPSSSRDVPENTPRIELYYQYWLREPPTPPPSCKRPVGVAWIMNKSRPVCRTMASGLVTVSVNGVYRPDGPAWAQVTLVTTPERLVGDMRAFRALARSVQPCRSTWSTDDGGHGTTGTGKRCPAAGLFF
jgi:hypothetical protein